MTHAAAIFIGRCPAADNTRISYKIADRIPPVEGETEGLYRLVIQSLNCELVCRIPPVEGETEDLFRLVSQSLNCELVFLHGIIPCVE